MQRTIAWAIQQALDISNLIAGGVPVPAILATRAVAGVTLLVKKA